MTIKTLAFVACAPWVLSLAACQCAKNRPQTVAEMPAINLLFGGVAISWNPESFERSAWPVVAAHDEPYEYVEYAETIYDDFGQHHGDDNNYRRRFESVRLGRYQK